MQGRLICTILLLLSLHSGAIQAKANVSIDIAVGLENFDFQPLFEEFSAQTGIKINILAFNNNQLKSELLQYADAMQLPDAVIIPSDYMGLSELRFSTIPSSWLADKLTLRVKNTSKVGGVIKGIPLMYGNHLVLYYNRSLVPEPITDLQHYIQQGHFKAPELGWNFYEMYWFITFVNALQEEVILSDQPHLDTRAMRLALSNYQLLLNSGIIDADCAYQCLMNRFKSAQLRYFVNGIWAYQQLKDTLKDNLAIASLPRWGGHQLISFASSHVLAFPANAVESEKKPHLKLLVEFMQSQRVQDRLWDELKALPTNSDSLDKLTKRKDIALIQLIASLNHTYPQPNEPIMAYIWEAILKGLTRYLGGVYSVEDTTEYMQFIVTKSQKNETKAQHR
ncbi:MULTISPECIES: extracellular solute-binding protein [unclassified Pseudoalteromonas]|uniref:sugar ABC transporter substrate-binding protein n=1 Tax=unclassified Pseudoalteromonas TaxID=194690 RepID=UPI000F64EAB6|nr:MULTISPECIES: extracellular solute-binding protein [unclassified Pseudoalteromonas]RRS09655.1 extracellular solute-binding protein [Pseudoalteromonas sp. J010]RXF05317.1 extracellular solute-binding protein [Pseudoalteromonas sp. PS5]